MNGRRAYLCRLSTLSRLFGGGEEGKWEVGVVVERDGGREEEDDEGEEGRPGDLVVSGGGR